MHSVCAQSEWLILNLDKNAIVSNPIIRPELNLASKARTVYPVRIWKALHSRVSSISRKSQRPWILRGTHWQIPPGDPKTTDYLIYSLFPYRWMPDVGQPRLNILEIRRVRHVTGKTCYKPLLRFTGTGFESLPLGHSTSYHWREVFFRFTGK